MLRPRVVPVLLLRRGGLVKTRRFRDATYVGDPRNAVRIFNDKEVDELAVLDIDATVEEREPDYALAREIVSEAFMPVAYGGGVTSVEQARKLFAVGIEKVVIGTAAVERPQLITEIARISGNQSVTVCIDARQRMFGRVETVIRSGRKGTGVDPVSLATAAAAAGAGELIIQAVDRDGEMAGYDLELIARVTSAVRVPVVALGGASGLDDLQRAIMDSGASAAAAGSLFVFHGRHRAVLISYPRPSELAAMWRQAAAAPARVAP